MALTPRSIPSERGSSASPQLIGTELITPCRSGSTFLAERGFK